MPMVPAVPSHICRTVALGIVGTGGTLTSRQLNNVSVSPLWSAQLASSLAFNALENARNTPDLDYIGDCATHFLHMRSELIVQTDSPGVRDELRRRTTKTMNQVVDEVMNRHPSGRLAPGMSTFLHTSMQLGFASAALRDRLAGQRLFNNR